MGKIFGIDLGTTYSCISYVDEYGKPVIVTNDNNSPVTPSVVYFEEGDNVSVGEIAKQALESDPENVCSTIKRQMGSRDFNFFAHGKEYSPETVSSLILQKLAKDASDKIGEEVKDVVITCPAYFGLDERAATSNAGEIAGLNVLSIINEPTAAAISYGVDVNTPQTIMVYDLGGGTFDVTIIKVSAGVIEVVASEGDHNLGGKDWDEAIRTYAINEYSKNTGNDADSVYEDLMMMGDLELKSETAKKQLSQRDKSIIRVESEKIEVTRDLFEQLTSTLLENTIAMTRKAMAVADQKGIKNYDKILLVGGSTMMPQVNAKLKQEFPNTQIEFCDPHAAVAKGAAIFGINKAAFPMGDGADSVKPTVEVDTENPIFAIGSGGKPKAIVIKNVISQSIAIRLVRGISNQILKNTPIPHSHTLNACTQQANQTNVSIEIFENASSDEIVDESMCKELVVGELGPLPANLPANAPIDVVFKIDDQGHMAIDAIDKTGNKTVHLEVQLRNEMTEEDIEQAKAAVSGLTVL